MRRVAAMGGLSCVIVLLTGCAPGGAVSAAAPTSSVSGEPSATPSDATQASVPKVPTGTIGSGTFTSDNGTTGEARFGFDGEILTLDVDDLVTPTAGVVQAMIAVHPLPADQTCFDSGFRIGFGTFEGGLGTGNSGDLSILSGDPSGIDQVILVTIPAEPFTAEMNCLANVVARADIDWTFAPLRGDLDPVDSGATGGARGVAETTDGRAVAYTVAPDDLIEEVAGRFGITVDDLFYLNNSRQPNAQQRTLRTGERLNLLLADR